MCDGCVYVTTTHSYKWVEHKLGEQYCASNQLLTCLNRMSAANRLAAAHQRINMWAAGLQIDEKYVDRSEN